MKQPATVVKKLLLGTILIVLSACLAMVVKESLDTQDPESALPILTVTCDGAPITDVYRAGYEWSFFATVERRTPQLMEEDLPLVPVDVNAQAEVRMNFSSPPSQLEVQRAQGLGGGEYLQVVSDDPSVFRAPTTPGVFVYKVVASWSGRGYIQYYFALNVRQVPGSASTAAQAGAASGSDASSTASESVPAGSGTAESAVFSGTAAASQKADLSGASSTANVPSTASAISVPDASSAPNALSDASVSDALSGEESALAPAA